MSTANWIVGPQLVGVLLLIISLILYRYPPKHINNFYGYKTALAQRNQQTWDEANRYSALYMIKCSIVIIIAGLIITAILNQVEMAGRLKEGLRAMFMIISGPAPCVLMIINTEKHLEKTFDQKSE